jgi:N-acetylmuramoyl-L-alanine amidase
VGKLLEANPKVDVIYTKDRCFVDLVERANMQIELMPIFRFHCNANRNTTADGTETYVMGMNKIASNLEAAKRELSYYFRERL